MICSTSSDLNQVFMCVHVCDSCVLLHNKLPQNLTAKNNKHLLSHSFCGLGIWEWSSWVVLAQGSHKINLLRGQLGQQLSQSSPRRGPTSKLTHVAVGKPQILTGC